MLFLFQLIKEPPAMKRQRNDDATSHSKRRSVTPATGDVNMMETTLQNMNRMLVECHNRLEEIRKQTRQRTREEGRREIEKREQYFQQYYIDSQNEIRRLKEKLSFVKRGLVSTKRRLEQIPHITHTHPQIQARVISIMNELISNYNMMQREVVEF